MNSQLSGRRRARPGRVGLVMTMVVLVATTALAGCAQTSGTRDKAAVTVAAPVGAADPVVPPKYPIDPATAVTKIVSGIDWREPSWVRAAANSGLYSEKSSDADQVNVRALDLTWRQINPAPGVLNTATATGSAQTMSFDPVDTQLQDDHPFWVRIFASGKDWAPEWVIKDCKVKTYGPDDDNQMHIPLWNECVWNHLMDTYRQLFVDKGLRADPRLRLVYVPGGYDWAEYDFNIIDAAVKAGDLSFAAYDQWQSHAWADLASIFGQYSNKLVYTGEDYPWSMFTSQQRATTAKKAMDAGLGIRNGIPEESNFHLSEAPSYGSHVQPNGHMTVDESLPIHDGKHAIGMENECFDACGFTTKDVPYSVYQTNLKSLQLHANWIYVDPVESALTTVPEHWDWVRLSLGQTAKTSPDAWAELRDAQDLYWDGNDEAPFGTAAAWPTKPWVRNLERWVVQRDVTGGTAHRASVDVRKKVLTAENGDAYEGLTTAIAGGDKGLYFDVDNAFAAASTGDVLVQVTFWDAGGAFNLRSSAGTSATITPAGGKAWRTASFKVAAAALNGSLTGSTDLAVNTTTTKDVTVKLIRVVRLSAPQS